MAPGWRLCFMYLRTCLPRLQPRRDMLQIARLKKKKLSLRDEITRLEDVLFPDIIA